MVWPKAVNVSYTLYSLSASVRVRMCVLQVHKKILWYVSTQLQYKVKEKDLTAVVLQNI